MKSPFVVFIFLISCVAAVARTGQANVPAPPPTPFEQTLMDAEKGFIDAGKKGDVAFFKRTLTDDFSFVAFDGQLYTRQEMLDQFTEGGFNIMSYEMKVIPISDSAAVVTYNVVLTVPASQVQGPPPRYQHFSTVWVKQGDAWKMKFQQMTANHWGDW